ncbi:MAG: preprotein translocase subunit SecG [Sphingobacteriales bacterium]|nr:preprotein translocase subunit SecG [Sphingobacteriales bacterium]
MVLLFVILIIIAAVVLGFIVLVQNPKGGGLAGNVAGFSNQFMGVKQTTDILEKGTWIFATVIGVLCLISTLFIPREKLITPTDSKNQTQQTTPASNGSQQQQPTNK